MDGPDDVDYGPVAPPYWYVDAPGGAVHLTDHHEGEHGATALCGDQIGRDWAWRRHPTSGGLDATCHRCRSRS